MNDTNNVPSKNIHGRLQLALDQEKQSHEARVQKFKSSPSRTINPQHSIKEGFWEHAQTQAEKETNERVEAQRRSSQAGFQGVVDAGFVRSQAEHFHRLMLARAPTAHAVRRTYARAVSILAKRGNDTGTNRELFPDHDGDAAGPAAARFVIGATHIYVPNMLAPGPAHDAFVASLVVAAAAHRPCVLVAGICDVRDPPPTAATTTSGPTSPGSPASPNCHMTAVALLSEAGEPYVALTIRPAPGHASDPAVYGRKRVVVFAEDGQVKLGS